nr:MAG TPA: hypothetical protein [Bacteriophage sp.]DAV23897.1 MAG TPA: hypothetical protein [Bacteriophage sp.]
MHFIFHNYISLINNQLKWYIYSHEPIYPCQMD